MHFLHHRDISNNVTFSLESSLFNQFKLFRSLLSFFSLDGFLLSARLEPQVFVMSFILDI